MSDTVELLELQVLDATLPNIHVMTVLVSMKILHAMAPVIVCTTFISENLLTYSLYPKQHTRLYSPTLKKQFALFSPSNIPYFTVYFSVVIKTWFYLNSSTYNLFIIKITKMPTVIYFTRIFQERKYIYPKKKNNISITLCLPFF